MRRREFITLIGGAAAWPLVALAQTPDRTRRVAVLMGSAESEPGLTYVGTFFTRLEELGWARDHNIRADVRWWNGGPEQMLPVVKEMVALSPDVIMVFTNLALAQIKPLVGNVAVVFVAVGDPVGSGFVASLAHPGGNITGFSSYDGSMGGKWLEVLKETAPGLTRVMAVLHPETPVHQAFWHSIEAAATRFGVQAIPGPVHDSAEIESAVTAFAVKENGGLIILPHAITQANINLLITLELTHRLPSIYAAGGSVGAGALVSYGFDFNDAFRHTAEYVDRILHGDKPSDLPVQEPTKFDLAFNLKTAKALGLTIPHSLLVLADEVIE
jgi:putative ABC transport system substrate-binding protein